MLNDFKGLKANQRHGGCFLCKNSVLHEFGKEISRELLVVSCKRCTERVERRQCVSKCRKSKGCVFPVFLLSLNSTMTVVCQIAAVCRSQDLRL